MKPDFDAEGFVQDRYYQDETMFSYEKRTLVLLAQAAYEKGCEDTKKEVVELFKTILGNVSSTLDYCWYDLKNL